MKGLSWKIKQLELSMMQDKQRINKERHILRRYTRTTAFVLFEIGTGFLAGYLLARKKTTGKMLGTLISLSLAAAKLSTKLKYFSRFIK